MALLRLLRERPPRQCSQETAIYDQLSPLFSQTSPTSSPSSIICSARCWRGKGRGLGTGHLAVTVMDGESETRTPIGDPPFSSWVLPVDGDSSLLMVISCAAPRSAFADVKNSPAQCCALLRGRDYCTANTLQSIYQRERMACLLPLSFLELGGEKG